MSCYVTLEFYRRFKLITDPEIELNSRINFLNVTFHGTIRRSASEMISHSYHIHTRKVQQIRKVHGPKIKFSNYRNDSS